MIIEYDFTTITEKDIFEMRLKDVIPDFGYITGKNRIPFLKFLVDNGFIERRTELVNNDTFYGRFMPQRDFRFSRQFDEKYCKIKPVIAVKGYMMYTDTAKRLAQWRDT